MSITKVASPTVVTAVGQVITYTYTVKNTGNVTLSGVGVTDNPTVYQGTAPATPTCTGLTSPTATCSGTTTTLAPNQVATFTTTYTVVQGDLDHGSISDTATANGTPPYGPPLSPPTTPPVTVTVTPSPSLSITKVASPTVVTAVGQVITYTYTVKNTGNVTLSGVGVTDNPTVYQGTAPATPTCTGLTSPTATCSGTTTTLAPNQVATFTTTYTVVQGDLDHGSISDTATANGTPPYGPPLSPPTTPPVTVTVTPSPSLSITKVASPTVVTAVGQVITYTYTVKNTGNVTLSGVGVTDNPTVYQGTAPATPTCTGLTSPTATCSGTTTTLAPNQVATFTTTYTVVQGDLDHGSISDTATANGTPPYGPPLSPPTTPPVTVTVTPSPSLSITKVASPTVVTAVGQVITYTYTVKNTGNVTLSGVGVTDNPTVYQGTAPATPTCTGLTSPTATCSGTTTTLAPNQVATFTTTYTVVQGDLDHGSISDTATANGTPPYGPPLSPPTTPPVTVTVTPSPSLSITKVASPTVVTAVGQVITYTYTVKNTGNVTLSGVGVTDNPTVYQGTAPATPTCTGLTSPTATCSGTTTTLAPNQVATFTTTYTVVQGDLDHGSISDTATANGTPPYGPPLSPPTTPPVTVTVTPSPSLSITKVASPTVVTAVGQVITYTYTVKNTGNVTLSGVGVTDNPTVYQGTAPATPTCTGLTSPTATCSGTTTTLAPNQVATFTTTYTVVQGDLDHGSISDTATANGTPPYGPPLSPPTTPPVTVTVTPSPSLSITKVASPTVVTAVGQVITYTYTVKNTGNVTLSGVGVTDNPTVYQGTAPATPTCTGLTSPTATCSGTTTTLAPNQVATFTTTYTVVQGDLDHGSISDTATANGTPPYGPPLSPPTTPPVTVTVTPSPSLSITKVASPTVVTAVGQVITYTYTVKNTGNVTLSGVGVTDNPTVYQGTAPATPTCTGLTSPTATCSGTTTTLAPNQVATFTTTYTVVQGDLDHGSISDTATANGTPPYGPPLSPPTTPPVTVTVTPSPSLSITKVASPTVVTAVGQVITYTYTVKNTGNVTLSGVGVTDNPTVYQGTAPATPTCTGLTSPTATCSGTTTTLAPNQVATFTTTYTVVQGDLDHGSISDTATANGTPPYGPPLSPPTTPPVTVTVTPSPSLSITKVASPTVVTAVGQVITYTYTVKNTGNVTLSGVGVTDNPTVYQGTAPATPTCTGLTSPTATCSGTTTTLAPNQVATFTTTYTVVQGDLDHGSISDTATANGTPPYGPPLSPPTTPPVTVTVTPSPSLSITKVASPTVVTAVGQVITYTYTVKNTGNVTLSGVGVTDNPTVYQGTAPATPTCTGLTSPTATCSGTTTTLAPNQVATFTTTYTVVQGDLDHGSISDTATANGTPPYGPPLSPPTTPPVTVTVTQTPGLTIVKTADPTSVTAAGAVVTYTFAVENVGNVTLSNILVDDSQQSPAGSLTSGPTCPSGSLAPQQTIDCSATYTVTQADMNNGSISDSATATGTTPTDTQYTTPVPGTATVSAVQTPGLTIVKTATPTTVSASGQVVTYNFAVTNTGNVTMSDITVDDTQTAPAGNLTSGPTCPSGVLNPGDTVNCTATYTVTVADMDNGSISDSATATGTTPSDTPFTTPIPGTVTVIASQSPGLTIQKSANPLTYVRVGQVVTYTFTVKNTGNVDLSNVAVTDHQSAPAGALATGPTCVSVQGPSSTCSTSTTATLAPNQTGIYTGTYKVTQADINHRSIFDSATATGYYTHVQPQFVETAGSHAPQTETAYTTPIPATALVTAILKPSLSIVTTAGVAYYSKAGETIPYSFLVTNTGNVVLNGITVTSSLVGLSAISCPTRTLVPGQAMTCTAKYTTTKQNLVAGSVVNNAVASGTPPGGTKVKSAPSGVVVPAIHGPENVTG